MDGDSKPFIIGSKHPQWKGDKVGYSALHGWVKRHLPKTELCEECKIVPPYDIANISQKYKRDLKDWEWLCRKCHMKKDGRIERAKIINIGRHRTVSEKIHLSRVQKEFNKISLSPPAINSRKIKCIRGHEFNKINTRITSTGERVCRACKNEYERRKRRDKRLAAA